MVSTMASAYEGLSEEERERVFLLAVGRDAYKGDDQNFCQGFAACADESDSSWWSDWDVAQRDVFFYMKTNPDDSNSWSYYCRYSMNTGRDDFDDTIRELLTLSASIYEQLQDIDVEITDDSLGDNETSIESELPSLDEIDSAPATNVIIPALSDLSPSSVSSSSSTWNSMPVLMLSAAVLGFSLS